MVGSDWKWNHFALHLGMEILLVLRRGCVTLSWIYFDGKKKRMCLLPGMLAGGPSLPSERARRLGFGLLVLTALLAVLAVLVSVLTLSAWPAVQNLTFCAVSYIAVLRRFRPAETFIFVEAVVCLGLLCLPNAVGTLSGIAVVVSNRDLFPKKEKTVQPWQIYSNLGVNTGIVIVYFLMALVCYLLYKDLLTTVIEIDEESFPFVGSQGGGGYGFRNRTQRQTQQQRQQPRFGTFRASVPPTGTYAATATSNLSRDGPRSQTGEQQKPRFPGKGYRLNS